MADVYKVLQPAKYMKEFISRDFRPDGRTFENFRWTVLNPAPIKTADGSCIAKLGHTKIVCGIKAELTKPLPEAPDEGFVVPNLEIPPLCSAQVRSGPPGEMAQACSQLVADIFRDAKCIDLKELCIEKDKLAWVLYCDMICVDYDGSIVDACLMALITALKTVTLPSIEYNAVTDMCVVNEESRIPLKILSVPVATTFTLFESRIMLADPTFEEEQLCGGPLGGTIVVSGLSDGQQLQRPGGAPLPSQSLDRALSLAQTRATRVQNLLQTALKS